MGNNLNVLRSPTRWLRITFDVTGPILIAFTLTGLFEASRIWTSPHWLLYVGGILFLGLLVFFQIYRGIWAEKLATITDDELNNLRIAVKDSIWPISNMLAEMPSSSIENRRSQVVQIADKTTSVTAFLLLKHIPEVRVNVFVLNPDCDALMRESSNGATPFPEPFDATTKHGQIALEWVKEAKSDPWVVADTQNNKRPGINRSARYRSFVSVVIRSGDFSYGMLTADSPQVDAFEEHGTPVEIAKLMAELLAVGYAIAYPNQSGGTKT